MKEQDNIRQLTDSYTKAVKAWAEEQPKDRASFFIHVDLDNKIETAIGYARGNSDLLAFAIAEAGLKDPAIADVILSAACKIINSKKMKQMRPIYARQGVEVYPDGTVLLVRCPKCNRENYALNVARGICTWCGYNAREDEQVEKLIQNTKSDETY